MILMSNNNIIQRKSKNILDKENWRGGQKGGYEYCLATLVVATTIALTGAGPYSLDARFFKGKIIIW